MIEIKFERGYYDHYDPDPLASIQVPIEGELPELPVGIRQDYVDHKDPKSQAKIVPSHVFRAAELEECRAHRKDVIFYLAGYYGLSGGSKIEGRHIRNIRLVWVKERNEWIVAAYSQEDWGADGHAEWYFGPYALDEYCFDRLLDAYNIPPGRLSFHEGVRTEPSEMDRIASNK